MLTLDQDEREGLSEILESSGLIAAVNALKIKCRNEIGLIHRYELLALEALIRSIKRETVGKKRSELTSDYLNVLSAMNSRSTPHGWLVTHVAERPGNENLLKDCKDIFLKLVSEGD